MDWTPFWIVKQPWSNGKIGGFGGSYRHDAMAAAIAGRYLVSMFPLVPYTRIIRFLFRMGRSG